MSNWGAGLNGLVSGLSGGMDLGQKIRGAMDEYSLRKVREQGIAEAQAAAEAAAPKLVDNGDAEHATANPQMSADPNAQPEPINTSLDALISNAKERQENPEAAARGDGIRTSAVDAPGAIESVPADMPTDFPSSKAPGTRADGSTLSQTLPNLDSFAKAGVAPLSAPKRFNVDGQEFDDEKAARDYIGKHTPQAESFYKDTLVPKMKARLLEMGRDKEAAAWDEYSDRTQTRENFKTWDKARRLADFGDHNGAAEELFKLHPHYADGYDLVGAERTKGPDGSDGFTMTVKGPDGETQKIFQNSETITRMGVPLLSPIEAFNKEYESLNKVDQARAKEAVDMRDDERRSRREQANIAQRDADAVARAKMVEKERDKRQEVRGTQAEKLEGMRQTGRLAVVDKKTQATAQAVAAKMSAGGGGYRKGKSPDEWKAQVVLEMGKADPTFFTKTPEEKQAAVDVAWNMMPDSIKNGVGKPASEVAYARGLPTTPNPFGAAPAPQGSLSVPPPDVQQPGVPGLKPGFKWKYNPATGMTDSVPQ